MVDFKLSALFSDTEQHEAVLYDTKHNKYYVFRLGKLSYSFDPITNEVLIFVWTISSGVLNLDFDDHVEKYKLREDEEGPNNVNPDVYDQSSKLHKLVRLTIKNNGKKTSEIVDMVHLENLNSKKLESYTMKYNAPLTEVVLRSVKGLSLGQLIIKIPFLVIVFVTFLYALLKN